MALLASCSSGDFWEKAGAPDWAERDRQAGEDALDPSISMSALSAAVRDGHVRLQWQPVKRTSRYRIDDGRSQMDVPAAICSQTCTLGMPPRPDGGRQQFAVSAVAADGAYSEASTATVQAPRPPDDMPARPLNEVVVIRQDRLPDDPENNPPAVERIAVDSAAAARREIEKTWSDPDVISASVNHPVATAEGDDPPEGSAPTNVLWQRSAMEFDRLPGDPRGDGITVALVESGGVDATHPSLKGAVEAGTSITGDGTGISSPSLHATATSSLIVGQPAGDIEGVAPGAKILPVTLGEGAKAADLVEGIIWAVDHGADIINISAGTSCNGRLSGCPDSVEAAAAYAEEASVVVVAAAGNNGPGPDCARPTNAPWSPAIVDSVISVGAYQADRKPWECSPLRGDIDVLAPGVHLMHAWPGGGYGTNNGTSFSAPLISGLIASILAERPDLEPADIRQMLPKWRLADGRLSTYAMLVDLDIIEIDNEQPRVGDMDLAGIYPFEAFIGIGTGHPMRKKLEATKDLQFGNYPDTGRFYASVSTPWWDGTGSGFGGSDPNQPEEPWGYGAIAGQVYLHKDGSVSAAGWMSLNRISPGFNYDRDLSGWYRMVCDATPVNTARKQFRWDTPVKVGVTDFTAGNDTTPARAKLTFSLGTGATTGKHGQLPPVTVGKDTLGDCPGQIAAQKGRDAASAGTPEELATVFDKYAKSVEATERMLVQATPVTTAEAVPLSGTDEPTETHAEQDPNIHLNIDVS